MTPADPTDLHRSAPSSAALDAALCIQSERVLRNDFTLSYKNPLYQVKDHTRARRIRVEERWDGSIHLSVHGHPLRYEVIAARPVRENVPEKPAATERRPTRPAADHSWRQLWKQRGREVEVPILRPGEKQPVQNQKSEEVRMRKTPSDNVKNRTFLSH